MSTRIHGLDVARALAICGMVAAHFDAHEGDAADTLLRAFTYGTASAAFAVLAGVSLSIMVRAALQRTGGRFAAAQVALGVRGLILMALWLPLAALQPYIAVVLLSIGVIFVALPFAVRLPLAWQLWLLAVFVTLAPLETALVDNDFLAFSPYPFAAWLAYGMVGVLVHRLVLLRPDAPLPGAPLRGAPLRVAVGASIVGAAGLLHRAMFDPVFARPGFPRADMSFLDKYFGNSPHTGGVLEVLTNASVAVALIAWCLVVCASPALVRWLAPVRALGSMALTFYVAHVLTARFVFEGVGDDAAAIPGRFTFWLAVTLVAGLVFAWVWRHFFRRGPLEWVMATAVRAATRPFEQDADRSVALGSDGTSAK